MRDIIYEEFETPRSRPQWKPIIVGIAAALIVIVIITMMVATASNSEDLYEDIYIVKRGDSLWSISGEFCPETMNRQQWISMVKERNGLSGSTIHPGQRLVVFY